MAQNSEDLRVQRTRRLLQKALIEATREKGFANVTVRDITKRAMVNRSTFYRHYLDKHDLLSQYLAELYRLLDSRAKTDPGLNRSDQQPGKPLVGLVNLLRHVQENADFYRVMLSEKGDPAFCARSFRLHMESEERAILPIGDDQTGPDSPPPDLIVNALMHLGMGAIVWWLENGQAVTPEQMAAWLEQLSTTNIRLLMQAAPKAKGNQSRDP